MKRIIGSLVCLAAATAIASSQAPPPPPAPPADVVKPAKPAPSAAPEIVDVGDVIDMLDAVPPMPPLPPLDLKLDLDLDLPLALGPLAPEVKAGVMAGLSAVPRALSQVDSVRLKDLERKLAQASAQVDKNYEQVERALEKARAMADGDALERFALAQARPAPAIAPMPPDPARARVMARARIDSEDRLYRRGTDALDRREWDRAAEAFDQVIESNRAKADGAFYWKAYALAKLAQTDKALATLAELEKNYPNSRWLNDAKDLQVEVRQSKGQPISPERESDEDLKLLAINSLINNDAERAVPLLKNILQGRNTPKLKERALFVLAQSQSPQARDIVVQMAKGGGNPDLQSMAIEYLGVFGGKENAQLLNEIYTGTTDVSIRRSILHGFMRTGEKERVLNLARNEQNQDLRVEAIRLLGHMGAQNELPQLYRADAPVEVRKAVLQGLFTSNSKDKLLEIARSEKDKDLKAYAIRLLGQLGRTGVSENLVALYSADADRAVKSEIVRALYRQGAAKEVVEIARRESDPELKREAVRMLSNMKSKEATDYLIELINK